MPAGDMDPVYSIGVNNRYDMIDSDMIEDPLELIRAAQEKPKKEKEPKPKGRKDVKTTKPAEKKTVKIETPAENDSDNKRNDRQRSDRGRGGGRGRGGRGRDGEGRGRGDWRGGRGGERRGRGSRNGFSPNSPNQEGFGFDNNNQGGFGNYQTQTDVSEGFGSGGFGGDGEERRGGRSGYRGGRGGRGGGRGRGRGGHREFDRRSGSDKSSVKAVDKRDGSGSYNWGTPQDDINAASEEHSSGFGNPKETEDVPAENPEQTTETEETPEPVDVGPQEITFEEYKKQQSRQKPEFNLRKVEGDKKSKELKKPTEKDNETTSAFFFPKKNVQETYKTSGRVKENLTVDIRYGSGDNRHFDATRRGGRGGNRGRRGGGGRRDDSAKSSSIALTNDEEFPSL